MRLRTVAVLAVVVGLPALGMANLLLNPGFDDNSGAGSTPNYWTGSGKQGVQSWGSHDGDGWLEAFWGWGLGTTADLYQDIEGDPNTVYTLDFWQEGDDAWNGTDFSVSMTWLDNTGGTLGSTNMNLQSWATVNNGWTNHVFQGISPDNTSTVRLQFSASPIDDGAGAAKVDDLDLTSMAIPEPTVAALVALGGLMGLMLRRSRKPRS